ncbi:MAG: NYN domain-containing protein [Chloroflexota bacterium]
MIYLIDGHNLIAKMPDIDLDDPNDEVKLIIKLRSWAAARRARRVIVVFDRGLPGGRSKGLSTGDITAVFAPTGKTADALLISRIRSLKNPREVTLVTSDQVILAAAKKRRMPAMRSEAFIKEMTVDKRPSARRQAAKARAEAGAEDEPVVSDKDVAEWMDLFGPVPEIPKAKPRLKKKKAPAPKPPEKKKAPPRPLAQQKRSEELLDEDEVAAWLELFGPEPEIPQAKPTTKKKEDDAPKAKPQKKKPSRTFQQQKRSDARLDEDEVAEWLRLFGDGE